MDIVRESLGGDAEQQHPAKKRESLPRGTTTGEAAGGKLFYRRCGDRESRGMTGRLSAKLRSAEPVWLAVYTGKRFTFFTAHAGRNPAALAGIKPRRKPSTCGGAAGRARRESSKRKNWLGLHAKGLKTRTIGGNWAKIRKNIFIPIFFQISFSYS